MLNNACDQQSIKVLQGISKSGINYPSPGSITLSVDSGERNHISRGFGKKSIATERSQDAIYGPMLEAN